MMSFYSSAGLCHDAGKGKGYIHVSCQNGTRERRTTDPTHDCGNPLRSTVENGPGRNNYSAT